MHLLAATMSTGTWVFLVVALGMALSFEFVNGFHDTANAVATVIYTHTLPLYVAVIWSGCWNLIGVLISSGAVAFSILALLPVELVVNIGSSTGFAMVFALLISAIIWNLGTWYLGLPASSSHTLIGSIMGVGLANSLLAKGHVFGEGVNWGKVTEVFTSLLVSPVVGFGCSAILLLAMKALVKKPELYTAPAKNVPPPMTIRGLLVLTCTGVSFAHGSNDGQKGMGLILLILIGILPGAYALNMDASSASVQKLEASAVRETAHFDKRAASSAAGDLTSDAQAAGAAAGNAMGSMASAAGSGASGAMQNAGMQNAGAAAAGNMSAAAAGQANSAAAAGNMSGAAAGIETGAGNVGAALNSAAPAVGGAASADMAAAGAAVAGVAPADAPAVLSDYLKTTGVVSAKTYAAMAVINTQLAADLAGKNSFRDFAPDQVKAVRTRIYLLGGAIGKLHAQKLITNPDEDKALMAYKGELTAATQYIPTWVKVAVALALGLGTMIGWKRIVVTVGEKIGKEHLTYAQGASAELVAMATIGAADWWGLPVSTTHVLSSGVAGTMAANHSGLQWGTLRNLLLAWVLTLPVCLILGAGAFSAGLFLIFTTPLGKLLFIGGLIAVGLLVWRLWSTFASKAGVEEAKAPMAV